MMRLFQDNPIGVVLASSCGFLLLMMLVLSIIWSLPASSSGDEDQAAVEEGLLNLPELAENEPIEKYTVISERPVFNESRQPVLALAEDDMDEGEDEEVVEDVDAPQVQLAGVIITPSLRMVTLRPEEGGESLIAFEGQPLEGNYGSWHVSRIEPREITLSSGDGEEVQLSLQVHNTAITPPPSPVTATGEQAEAAQATQEAVNEDGEQVSRAEQIRQRIAERREELRRQAEENKQAQSSSADYRSKIQQMINGNRQQAAEEEQN